MEVSDTEPSNSGKLSWSRRSSKKSSSKNSSPKNSSPKVIYPKNSSKNESPKSSARSSPKDSRGAAWGADGGASTAQSRLRPADVEPPLADDEFAMAEAAAEADASRTAAVSAGGAQGIGHGRVLVSELPEAQKAPAKGCCCIM